MIACMMSVMTGLPMSVGNRMRSSVVCSVGVSVVGVSVAGVGMAAVVVTSVTMRITMTVSMATQATNRHPCKANSAKRECGEIYVH